ncbi:hypothetical protein FOB80_06970 [Aerococcus viridans]|nr:hypothetical protein FOB80_06970 [Aerococcus viridans]
MSEVTEVLAKTHYVCAFCVPIFYHRQEEICMPANKDKSTGKWYFSIRYQDDFGANKRKVRRGFKTKKLALEAEREFLNK